MLDDRNINLVEEGIDVALRMGPLSDSSLTARKIADCRRVVLGSRPTSPATASLRPTDLDQHQGIVYNLSGGATWTFTKGGEQQTQTLTGRLRVSAAEGLRAAVLADQGLAIASQWMFAPELASGAVRAVMMIGGCRIRICGRCSPRGGWSVRRRGRLWSTWKTC
jgi:DNA-binding transcriptional LysR family regulator